MTQDAALIIRVNLRKDAGYFYADSPDLLGLHICGKTAEQTCETVMKAVKALFKHNRGMDVEVLPATTSDQNFPRISGPCEQFAVLPRAHA
jgi:hypothetical protein